MIPRDEARSYATQLQAWLDRAGADIGVKFSVGRYRYGEVIEFKVTLAPLKENGEAVSVEAEAFKRSAHLFGLKSDDLGRQFTSNGTPFKITGLMPRRRAYPIQAVNVWTGKPFKFSANSVRILLAREAQQ